MSATARRAGIVIVGAGLVYLTSAPSVFGAYAHFIVGTIAVTCVSVVAVSLLAGLSGIWSLGHPTFLAFGAYTAALMAAAGYPVEAIFVVAVGGAALLGFVLGLSAGRFSVLYFGLLTLALAMAANEVMGQWTAVTGGDQGIQVSKAHLATLGTVIDLKTAVPFGITIATCVFLLGDIVGRGAPGRRWRAVKSQRTASMAIGLRPAVENALAFAFSAALAATAGIVTAFQIGYLDPQGFSLDVGVTLIVATVVGGVGSFAGAIAGAAFVVVVPELARGVPAVSPFVYGVATVLVLLFLRRGIIPSLLGWTKRFRAGRQPLKISAAPPVGADAVARLVSDLISPARHALVCENLSVRFGGILALDGVSLTVAPGTVLGLIGPNGAGKTTLLNVLSGFVLPTSDSVARIGASDLIRLPPTKRTLLGFGRTFQHAELFAELTVRENIATAARAVPPFLRTLARRELSAGDVAERLVVGLGLSTYADAMPAGLPFGVQKIVDIARTLAVGASIVAMDEPFSGLDASERAELRAVLSGMRQAGASIVVIDHAVQEVLDIADRVLVLDFGRPLASGTPAEIRNDPAVQQAYFGALATAALVIHA